MKLHIKIPKQTVEVITVETDRQTSVSGWVTQGAECDHCGYPFHDNESVQVFHYDRRLIRLHNDCVQKAIEGKEPQP